MDNTPEETPENATPDKKKMIIGAAVATAVVALGGGIFILTQGGGGDPQQGTSDSASIIASSGAPTGIPVDPTAAATQAAAQEPSPAESTPVTRPTAPDNVFDVSRVGELAQNVLDNIKKGDLNGKAWADHMKDYVTPAMYETMKHSGSAVIPDGKTVETTEGEEVGQWVAKVKDDAGNTVYTFTIEMVAIRPDLSYVLVSEINGLPTNEGTKDENGYPVATAPQPLNEKQYDAMKTYAYSVAQSYLNFSKSDTVESRKEVLEGKLPGGFPEFQEIPEGAGYDVQSYKAERVHIANPYKGESVPDDAVGVVMDVPYADAAFEPVKELGEVRLQVNFKWNDTGKMWMPDSLQVLRVTQP